MKNEIQKLLVYTLANTCVILILLVVIALIIDGHSVQTVWNATIQVSWLFQILGANAVIHFVLFLIRRFESKYVILEYLFGISLIIVVALVFSVFFDWFATRRWILVVMAVVLYIFGLATNTIQTRKNAQEMNELLQKRKKKIADKELW